MKKNKPLIFGNWKMHGSFSTIKPLLSGLQIDKAKEASCQVAVFPPFVYLQFVSQLLKGSPIALGAQNIYPQAQGPFTGEVSGAMLQEVGCQYVLVGHSERRHGLGESNAFVAKKFSFAQGCGLVPVLCVGETLEEREKGLTEKVLREQIEAIYALGETGFLNSIVAYEPVWAIGTGKVATLEQVQAAHAFIRQVVREKEANEATLLPILYGGSVTPEVAADLFALSEVNGALVGGASLDAEKFMKIIESW